LKRDRRTSAKKLAAAIQKKGSRFEKAGKELIALRDDYGTSGNGDGAERLIAHFAQICAEFPSLNEENLHDFRKRIKSVRYLAEINPAADKATARIATQMKKLQGTIGEWHDWQALAAEALRGNRAWSESVAELIASIARETFDTALETAHTIIERVLGKSADTFEALPRAGHKRPTHGEAESLESAEQKLA
jgi:hypothetical protein